VQLGSFSRGLDEKDPRFWRAALALVVFISVWPALMLYLMIAQGLGVQWPLGTSIVAEVLYLPFFFSPGQALGKDVAFIPLVLYVLFKLAQAGRYCRRRLLEARSAGQVA
jgi:hypothetical protein